MFANILWMLYFIVEPNGGNNNNGIPKGDTSAIQ